MINQKRRAGQYASTFDGSNDYLMRGGDLTGNADGKAGTISAWLKLRGGDAAVLIAYTSTGGGTDLSRLAADVFEVSARNSGGTAVLKLTSDSTYTTSSTGFIHVLASWDLANAKGHLYINDADDLAVGSTITDDDIDYTRSEHVIGRLEAADLFHWDGDMSEMYLNFAEYVDITVEANRRRFISAQGLPVMLGSNGERPTGNQPIIYMPKRFNEFQINKGYGGDFTVTGALDYAKGPRHG